ncbi:group II intron reverse transcriptase/maturase [Runella sp.]|jgi:RNA-directed DNA polymerase|uniref:group II intron reverse transcriptase/maturase n=1 Tax=Runella sp. TaxID=1960881 RepID=UPI00260CFA51|nr:group II intron reverse transcriptase/maturase [Runella sp.]
MIDYYETKSQPITRAMVWQAYKEVRANGGSGGIDGMSWTYLDKNLKTELFKLWNRLASGTYFPQPVKQVAIAKKDGGIRNLGIPTLLDGIAQQVVRQHLERIVEPQFHKSSYGYRPNRSCHDAVISAQINTFNHDFAVDIDIKGYFDNIDHELLLKAVAHYCQDKWVLMYVRRWLEAGVVQNDKTFVPSTSGTPQGGVISPLLSNIFLHVVFDKWMEKIHPEKPFERYADDMVVHCKTEKQAQFMMKGITRRMNDCKLNLHPTKTQIVNLRGESIQEYAKKYDFLGFTIKPSMVKFKERLKVVPSTFVSTKSKKSILQKFKSLEIHKWRKPLLLIAKEVNQISRGLINYYHKFENKSMRYVWNQLNHRLLKWVKWEKGLYKYDAVRWLKHIYKDNPKLFVHWALVHP